ncbi:LegC family aminotransferase [Bdellovibrio svalbardensis]|uniref:LegC family aminotransferase n=1 Tax=Bdellovibrio svalbardensis TaxID=2972972 RepID=A0ABT6DMN3_9BACT|nr:LegC family aminotransferase [Bdellovibrio svalbardensis]MDG0817355.1 LegC family aminotransferase [Bdellovibrio svalbardensis]
MFDDVRAFIRNLYPEKDFIALHEPYFAGNEKKYVLDCIDSTYVSSVGKYVDRFEQMMADFTGAKYAIATMNGTAALHVALMLVGVGREDEVITQPLTFVATCNAIAYVGAKPVFVDVDRDTLGMSAQSLKDFLHQHAVLRDGACWNRISGKKISAVLPMHTFGHPCRIDEIAALCEEYKIPLVEDSAESLGSYYKGVHTGRFGKVGVMSFNGNKTITTGGGGIVITDDPVLAKRAKHMTTTSKRPHPYEYVHDEVGYNYRLPNINAALGCAQLESLPLILQNKRELAKKYQVFFLKHEIKFVSEPSNAQSNFWLNAILLADETQRNSFLEETNSHKVMTRPVWKLMNRLEMYKDCFCMPLVNSEWIEERLVNIPSSCFFQSS